MLPNLIILGAMKCATTSLHYYLRQHPQIGMSAEKELNFFVEERNWTRGLEWYAAQFPEGTLVRGEASPNYTAHPLFAGVAERMHAIVPEARLIYVVRDPIERIISQHMHRVAEGRETRSLDAVVLQADAERYIARSLYFEQLAEYRARFADEQILVLTREQLLDERSATLRRVFRFLDVEASFASPRFARVRHASDGKRRRTRVGEAIRRLPPFDRIDRLPYAVRGKVSTLVDWPFSRTVARPTLSPEAWEALATRLRHDVDQLRGYTGMPLADWSI